MNFYNYLYNISLLEIFIDMGRWLTSIKPGYFGFKIWVGGYSINFDKHKLSFELDYGRFSPLRSDIIEYNRDAKEMKLNWNPIGR